MNRSLLSVLKKQKSCTIYQFKKKKVEQQKKKL